MSKRIIPVFSVIIAGLVIILAVFMIIRDAKFELSNEMYGEGQIINTTIEDVEDKIIKQQSFALFVSQPGCRTADDLRKIIKEFASIHHLIIYEIDYSGLRESGLVPGLKFYPSFVVFRRGKPIDFLEADNSEDVSAYSTLDGFSTWFTDHIIMKDWHGAGRDYAARHSALTLRLCWAANI